MYIKLLICLFQVLKVISFKALRSKIKTVVVTDWSGEYGACDRQIYLSKQSLQNGAEPQVGSKVINIFCNIQFIHFK